MENWEKFLRIVEMLGEEQVCSDLNNYMSEDEMGEFVEYLMKNHEITEEEIV